MNQNQQFNAAIITEKFNSACNNLNNFLSNDPSLNQIKTKLNQDWQKYKQEGLISVAFVGQYSAGKSTIISALTGKRDIKIDADISTDKTASYNWNGIKIIDTPGLFTDRADHDAITYQAIDQADLLVFSLTYMLFDSITVKNFKKLAYEKGYAWKMMLLVNKMSDEAGEDEQKIINYRYSLAEALKPYSLDDFPVCFVDAKDYCDSVDQKDEFLREISRFDTFIRQLNQFVARRGSLAKLDTPVRIALSAVNDTQAELTRIAKADPTFIEILNQLSRQIKNERNRIKIQNQGVALRLASAIADEGSQLAKYVGNVRSEHEWEYAQKTINSKVEKHYEKAGRELQGIFDNALRDIKQQVEGVIEGNLVQTYITYIGKSLDASVDHIRRENNNDTLKNQFNTLRGIAESTGANILKNASRSFLSTASTTGLLRSMDVVGSGLHQTVLGVGKFIGFKFKPWQAVGIAKNLGNFAIFLGPIFAVGALGLDLHEMSKARQLEQDMANARGQINSQYQKLAKDLEHQVEIQFDEFDKQVYGEIEKMIANARKQNEDEIALSNRSMRQLISIRQEFEQILTTISQINQQTTRNF
ncbi:GTP-binding protein HSR1-related protein [Chondrocystis sp. NIES-4102]|nr:GTP-binding protein HSR1-related protein [Chondrocystis sp. NIES-4102]